MDKELSTLRRNLVLCNACLTTFMATIDGSIVNVAMPVIAKYFKVNISTIQWIVTIYLLTISAILLTWGKISDLYGKKKLFAVGIFIFTIGSLFCGLSTKYEFLVFSRIIQAIGASITMALVQGIVTTIFPANERGKALGLIGTSVAIGSLVGPTLGGVLVHLFNWQSIFYINIPIGIIGVLMTIFIFVESPVQKKVYIKFDWIGSVLFSTMIVILFLGLLMKQDNIINNFIMSILIGISILILFLFIKYESKAENPLIKLDIFKNKIFSSGLITSGLSFIAMFGYVFFMPFYLQFVLNIKVLESGLIMAIFPIATGLFSSFSGNLSDKYGYRPLTILGLSINAISLLLLSLLKENSSLIYLGIVIFMYGSGCAIFSTPNNSSIMGSVSKSDVGIAGSICAFFRNFGMVTGTTISVILFTFVTNIKIDKISKSTINPIQFLNGFRVVMIFSTIIMLIAIIISFKRTEKSLSN